MTIEVKAIRGLAWGACLWAAVGCGDPVEDVCTAADAYAETCPVVTPDRVCEGQTACRIGGVTQWLLREEAKACEAIHDGCDEAELDALRRFWECAGRGAICNQADYVACEDRVLGVSPGCIESVTSR